VAKLFDYNYFLTNPGTYNLYQLRVFTSLNLCKAISQNHAFKRTFQQEYICAKREIVRMKCQLQMDELRML